MRAYSTIRNIIPPLCFALGFLVACGPKPVPQNGQKTPPKKPVSAQKGERFSLTVDANVIDRVQLVGDFKAKQPIELKQRKPGYFVGAVPGLKTGQMVRYQFRVHRKDLGKWLLVSDPMARQLDASTKRMSVRFVGNDVPAKPLALKKARRFQDLMIYELCPREFSGPGLRYGPQDELPSGQGPKAQFGNAFAKLTETIEKGYFNKLGVNAIELMPVFAQGWYRAKDGKLKRPPWGYQAMSWYAINGDFGTAHDFAKLVAAAHKKGLAVLVDVSLEHGYGGKENGLITDLFPSWRQPKPKNPWGLLELKLDDQRTIDFLVAGLRRLLVDYDVDGIRFDWTDKVPAKHWKKVIARIRSFKKGAILVSENPRPDLLTKAGFDGVWDFFFQWEAPLLLRQAYRNWDGFAGRLVDTQDKLVENIRARGFSPHGAMTMDGVGDKAPGAVRYIESHDLPRIARDKIRWQTGGNQLLDYNGDKKVPDILGNGSRAKSRLAATLLLTLPGAVMLLQGQEFGARDDLTWSYDPLNWKDQDKKTFEHYAALLKLRATHPELRSLDLRIIKSDTKRHTLVYSRGTDPKKTDDDRFVVVLNFGPKAVRVRPRLPKAGLWIDVLGKKRYRGRRPTLRLPHAGFALLAAR
jgi:1,4-alpha-glucan branching enzyme